MNRSVISLSVSLAVLLVIFFLLRPGTRDATGVETPRGTPPILPEDPIVEDLPEPPKPALPLRPPARAAPDPPPRPGRIRWVPVRVRVLGQGSMNGAVSGASPVQTDRDESERRLPVILNQRMGEDGVAEFKVLVQDNDDDPRADWMVSAYHPKLGFGWAEVPLGALESQEIEVELVEGRAFRGRVLDKDLTPIQGAIVSINMAWKVGNPMLNALMVESDSDGTFHGVGIQDFSRPGGLSVRKGLIPLLELRLSPEQAQSDLIEIGDVVVDWSSVEAMDQRGRLIEAGGTR
jgi:hypothetical protein